MSVKTFSRSAGQSTVAAAAYRAGVEITDERTGVVHDYSRKSGVIESRIVAPEGADWATDRARLWNAAEVVNNRKNSTVAREYEIGLPHELDDGARANLAHDFAKVLCDRYGIAADVSIHEPSREGDKRNFHAHILTTTHSVTSDGWGGKTRILDSAKTGAGEITKLRETFAAMCNAALQTADISRRMTAESNAAQAARLRAETTALSKAGKWKDAAIAETLADAVEAKPRPEHLGVHAAAVERKAQRRAKRSGRAYVPVTDRGRSVAKNRNTLREIDAIVASTSKARERLAVVARQRVEEERKAEEAKRAAEEARQRAAMEAVWQEAERQRIAADAARKAEAARRAGKARQEAERQRLAAEAARKAAAARLATEAHQKTEAAQGPRDDEAAFIRQVDGASHDMQGHISMMWLRAMSKGTPPKIAIAAAGPAMWETIKRLAAAATPALIAHMTALAETVRARMQAAIERRQKAAAASPEAPVRSGPER